MLEIFFKALRDFQRFSTGAFLSFKDPRTWSTRTRCGMRNASPALSAGSQSAHRVSWPGVTTSTALLAMRRSLPRNASNARRYKEPHYYYTILSELNIMINMLISPIVKAHHLWRDQLPGPSLALGVFCVRDLP